MNARQWAEKWIAWVVVTAVLVVVAFYLIRLALDVHSLRHGIYGDD